MAIEQTFGFFEDANLTIPLSSMPFIAIPGTTINVDKSFFYGSPAAGRKIINKDNLGTQLVMTFEDTDLAQGVDATDFVLALSAGALPGSIVQSVNMGAEILSGVGNAVEVFVRYTPPIGFEGNDPSLQFKLSDIAEIVV